MPFKNADYLPSYEELDVQEIEMSAAPMRAGAHHFGKYCDRPSKEFMLCNQEEQDPRKCLQYGKEVTRCGLEFFRKVKKFCPEEFTHYWECIDNSHWDMSFRNCRQSQAAFDGCIKKNLDQDRPDLGFFSKIRILKTARPRPDRSNLPLPERLPGKEDIDPSQPPPEFAKSGYRTIFQ